MSKWEHLIPPVREVAHQDGIHDEAIIEEVAQIVAMLDPLSADVSRPLVTRLLYTVERTSIKNGPAASKVGTAIRMTIRGFALRLICQLVGLDDEFADELITKVRGYLTD